MVLASCFALLVSVLRTPEANYQNGKHNQVRSRCAKPQYCLCSPGSNTACGHPAAILLVLPRQQYCFFSPALPSHKLRLHPQDRREVQATSSEACVVVEVQVDVPLLVLFEGRQLDMRCGGLHDKLNPWILHATIESAAGYHCNGGWNHQELFCKVAQK